MVDDRYNSMIHYVTLSPFCLLFVFTCLSFVLPLSACQLCAFAGQCFAVGAANKSFLSRQRKYARLQFSFGARLASSMKTGEFSCPV